MNKKHIFIIIVILLIYAYALTSNSPNKCNKDIQQVYPQYPPYATPTIIPTFDIYKPNTVMPTVSPTQKINKSYPANQYEILKRNLN